MGFSISWLVSEYLGSTIEMLYNLITEELDIIIQLILGAF